MTDDSSVMPEHTALEFSPTPDRPWQVSGVRGRIVSGKREYIYHGIGPDGVELAAVWFDTRTGAGLRDAHWIVRACNSHAALVEALKYVRASLGDPVPIGRRHIARVVDDALTKSGAR